MNAQQSRLRAALNSFRETYVQRVPCTEPLSPRQLEVAALLSAGQKPAEIAKQLGVAYRTIVFHITTAAERIPGDMAGANKVVMWYRGASAQVLGVKTGTP